MGKQKRGKTRMKPQVSSWGRWMNSDGVISTPAFRKNSNVAPVQVYGKKHYAHDLVCHTYNGPPPSEAEQEVLHLNQFPDFRPDSYMHAKAWLLAWGTHSQNTKQSHLENKTRGSSADQQSIPILGKKVDDDQWVAYASVSEAARIIGINSGSISAVVNGKQNQTAGFIFKIDESRALPEVILTDDDGHVEEWRPVKKWKFVDGTWVDIFADL